jgi:hypothetical protein
MHATIHYPDTLMEEGYYRTRNGQSYCVGKADFQVATTGSHDRRCVLISAYGDYNRRLELVLDEEEAKRLLIGLLQIGTFRLPDGSGPVSTHGRKEW